MALNILIIGGVALGTKAATRARRIMPDANITLIDQGTYISYGGCGIPYFVGGEVSSVRGLRTTGANVIRDEAFFDDLKGVKAICHTRALSIDRKAKTVLVENVKTGEQSTMSYDKLVIATGARPIIPSIPGTDLKNVTAINGLEPAMAIEEQCAARQIKSAVILGTGFIGLEMGVALAKRGIKVTVIGNLSRFCRPFAQMARKDLEDFGITVVSGEKVVELKGRDGAVCQVVTDKQAIDADQVIISVGVKPNDKLAADAGLLCHPKGGIMVNSHMQTSDPDIYAGGDAVVVRNLISGDFIYLPLGSMANRQGRVIGCNLGGQQSVFEGAVGSWCVKMNKMYASGAGLTVQQAREAGFDAVEVTMEGVDKAHFYPNHGVASICLVVDRQTRRVLGIQGMSADGSSIKARTDAVAAQMQIGKPTLNDISNLEVCYSPPFAGAMDVINAAANVTDNVISGLHDSISPDEFVKLWEDRANNNYYFIDIRPAKNSKPIEERHPGEYLSLPLEEFNARKGEVPADRPVALVCNTGTRAYEAQIKLRNMGIKTVNSAGGFQALKKRGDDTKF